MTSNDNELHALLPAYLNGQLASDEQQRLEQALTTDVDLQRELAFLKAIQQEVKTETVTSPTEWGLAKLRQSLDAETKTTVTYSPGNFQFWKRLAIAASLVVAVQMGLLVNNRLNTNPYIPLSTPEVESTLQVQFIEDATEQQIRELLLQTGGSIVKGPSAIGIYRIQFDDTQTSLEQLTNNPIVVYAEQEQ